MQMPVIINFLTGQGFAQVQVCELHLSQTFTVSVYVTS